MALVTLAAGNLREVNLDGTSVLLANDGGTVYALDAICPHQGGILADGTLDRDSLVCPEHGATFDVRSGAVLVDPHGVSPPQGAVDALRTYPTRVESGMIEVDLS